MGDRHIWQAGVWHRSGCSHFPSQRGGRGDGRRGFPGPLGKREELANTPRGPESDGDGRREIVRPCSPVCASVGAGGGRRVCS